MNVFNSADPSNESGTSIQQVVEQLAASYSAADVRYVSPVTGYCDCHCAHSRCIACCSVNSKEIEVLASDGNLYSTIDEEHYKSMRHISSVTFAFANLIPGRCRVVRRCRRHTTALNVDVCVLRRCSDDALHFSRYSLIKPLNF